MRTILGLGRRCQLVGGCGSNEDEDEDVNVEGASKSRIAPPRSPPKAPVLEAAPRHRCRCGLGGGDGRRWCRA
jgi:hypothetical protein